MDGTLANTCLDFAQMCRDSNLPEGTRILEYCASLQDKNRAAEILAIVEQHEMAGASNAQWILDAQTVLNRFAQKKLPMAIVTRNMQAAAKLTVKSLAIPINLIITRDECRPKPDPQGLLMVADMWNIQPEMLIYVGDFEFDLLAAKRAGMLACLLLTEQNKEFIELADLVIKNFSELENFIKNI